jgi:hypothetical protein
VVLSVVPIAPPPEAADGAGVLEKDVERARQLERELTVHALKEANPSAELIRLAREDRSDLMILNLSPAPHAVPASPLDVDYLVRHAPCRVFLAAPAALPQELEEQPAG